MTDTERVFLEDTYNILSEYNKFGEGSEIKEMAIEIAERIQRLLNENVSKEDTGLYEQHEALRHLYITESIKDNHEALEKLKDTPKRKSDINQDVIFLINSGYDFTEFSGITSDGLSIHVDLEI